MHSPEAGSSSVRSDINECARYGRNCAYHSP
jgi:hypothetical protein